MIRFLACFLLFFSLLLPPQLPAATSKLITLNVPDSVLSQALDKSLPISIDTSSDILSGAITIVKISNLQINDQGIAGQTIKLKVGSLQLDLRCNAILRFDAVKQVLYVKPLISDLQASSSAAQGDINALLMTFLNNREFPVKLQQLEPLIAETSGKMINIKMNIVGIRTHQGIVQFEIMPLIQTTNTVANKK